MASDASPPANESSHVVSTYEAPSAYPPCIHAAKELDPIAISQMKIETHHRGKRVVVRAIISPFRRVALVTFIEDEEGNKTGLQMFNQPSEQIVPARQTLRFGSCYLIKEPFVTAVPPDDYCLRVDHPGDIFLLPLDHELVPAKWRKSANEALVGKSREMRMRGNDAVGKKKWAEAEDFYTTAARIAETAEEVQLAYLNRSLANLRLERPATALADAIKSHEGDSLARTEKGLFREASALYQLARYDQCLDRLHAHRNAYPTNSSALTMIERAQARLQEQQSGQYDFRHMYKQAEATPPLIDCATYTMPVEIRNSPGKGRGVFTTRKVLAGDLLICEKAFGYIYGGKDHPSSRDKTALEIDTDLQAQIVQKLLHNIEDARLFGDLHHGDYDAVSVNEVDGKPVVDACLVQKVISLTNYHAPRTSLSLIGNILSMDVKGLKENDRSIGIWSFISHINHSCISNVGRSFLGDMQIIRATRDIEAGADLLISYRPALPFEFYDDAKERLGGWGFVCDCALCLDRKTTPKKVLLERKLLSNEILPPMGSRNGASNIAKAQKALDRLNQTYSAPAREPGAIRMELWRHYHLLGQTIAKPSEAIEMFLRGLEALGFIISARPRRGVAKSSKPELRVTQWGQATWTSVEAFWALNMAYKSIAPQNSAAAREYLELAYAMFVGEKDTVLDTYPGLG